jgi:pimeloyl-ACP methyl ester carboxylesterase
LAELPASGYFLTVGSTLFHITAWKKGLTTTMVEGIFMTSWLIKLYTSLNLEGAMECLTKYLSFVRLKVRRIPTRSVAKVALKSWVARGFQVNEIFAEQFILGLQNWNWNVNKKGYSSLMPCTFSDEELSRIRHNVLLLIGDQDRLNPPKALERARRLIPNLEGEIIPQAGHFLNLEQPDLVNKHVLAFLKKPVLHINHG